MNGLVLSMFDRTGNMLRPWADAGYRCMAVDLRHTTHEADGIEWVGADVAAWLPPRCEYRIVFAFPPCTDLAVSGARWYRTKGLGALAEALRLVDAGRQVCEWSDAPWMLENPVSTLSTYWREPDHRFDPCDYGAYLDPPGDAYTKRTCLWVGGGFVMPPARPVPPAEGSKMHRVAPGPLRADIRSETPRGFAQAVFLANTGQTAVETVQTGLWAS